MKLNQLTISDSGAIAINYGRVANNLPTPSQVVELLKFQGLTRVKLYNTDYTVLTALANSGIKVVFPLLNEFLSSAAAGQSFIDSWVQANITKYHRRHRRYPGAPSFSSYYYFYYVFFFLNINSVSLFVIHRHIRCYLYHKLVILLYNNLLNVFYV